jgi:hypothetical protein
LTVATGQQ